MVGSGELTIQAYASATGDQDSNTASASYTLIFPSAATPVISLAPGLYSSAQTVTISDTSPGTQIYYSTNGTYPSSYANLYSGPITVSSSEVVTAVASGSGYSASPFTTAQYDIASSSSRFLYTIAGNYTPGYTGDGGPATFAELNGLQGIAVDGAGNVYIADSGDNVVREIAASTGIITTIAGTGVAGHTGDNGPATSAELWTPSSLAVDAVGNLYIAETGDNVIRLINAGTGTITTFAGNPSGTGSLGGPADNYPLFGIGGITLDLLGANLYIANEFNVVEVNIGNGVVSLPNGLTSFPGFGYLTGITVDPESNIYVSDQAYGVVRKISAQGAITVFAGGGYGGDGVPATNGRLYFPAGLAVDRAGNIYIADEFDCAIREVNTSGIINTIAGILNDEYADGGDGSPANNVGLFYPQAVASDAAGNIYLTDLTFRVRKVTVPAAPPSSAAAAPVFSLSPGTYSNSQTLTITDPTPGAEVFVSLNGSAPTTAGQGYHGPIDITGTVTVQAIASAPGYLASAPVTAKYTISTPPSEVISTVAGTGAYGFTGFGGPATGAKIGYPWAVAVDSSGNLFISDTGNYVVWKVAAGTGIISIVAGTGIQGGGVDGELATQSPLSDPYGIAVDKLGNLYIADTNQAAFDTTSIRMVAAQTGIITTVVGPGVSSALGDGGPATSAFLGSAYGLAFDNAGNLYIADSGENRIRMVTASTGIISTVAGGGTAGLGDGGLATAASLAEPTGIALDSTGNLYISDQGNARIRKVDASTGVITTIAGTGNWGDTGDGGSATEAEVSPEQGIAVDSAGNVYLSSALSTIRKVDATTGIISTIAGDTYTGYGGDEGAATMAELADPESLAVDAAGSLYIADLGNSAVRKAAVPVPTPAPSFSLAAGTYVGAQTVTISDSVQGAAIYYTTDGSTPTTASDLYSGSISISATETLRAIAVATGYAESAVTSAAYTIVLPVIPTISVTPSAASITTAQSLTVAVSVNSATGNPTPTGSVTLTSGSYTSATTTLTSGSASITVPAGSLAAGADTLTASYSGDANYTAATGTAPVTVTIPIFTIAGAAVSVAAGASTGNTSTITLTPAGGFTGSVALTAALASGPTGAVKPPTFSFGTTTPVSITGAAPGTATLTISTTASSTTSCTAANQTPRGIPWFAGSGAVLACVFLFGIPARRRRWQSILGMLLLLAALGGGLVACGGGGTSPCSPATTPGTTAGAYTITVTGTSGSLTETGTVTLTVQ
jgi:sugar lactone lactonase YvrE